jgi:rhodanese-related sulfurtransferase
MNYLFGNCKLKISGVSFVLPSELVPLLQQGAILIDLREEIETEISAFGLEKVHYLPHPLFEKAWESLPLDSPLVLADSVGLWSKKFTLFLHERGYRNVASLAGGFSDWQKDGFPVKKGRYAALNGPCPCMIVPRERGRE